MIASPSAGESQSGTVFCPFKAIFLLKLQKPVGTEAAVQTLPRRLLQKQAQSGLKPIKWYFGSH